MDPQMLHGKHDEIFCRICGLIQDTPPWGVDGKCPTYEICSCCGVEFGNEDSSLEWIHQYRNKWESDGYNWFEPKRKPIIWDPRVQMTQIPAHYL